MVKLRISTLRSASSLDVDTKQALCGALDKTMQVRILGGENRTMNPGFQLCDAVCLPQEMGVCHCYMNLA